MKAWEPQFDSWFAGFADGEGCFYIDNQFRPRFVLKLRADDLAVLEMLREAFGGSIYMQKARAQDNRAKPQACWSILSKRDVATLVRYFDAFPLHAKKARDYAIWRRAVMVWCGGSRHSTELPALRDALMAGRAYDGIETDLEERSSPQLRLVEDG